MRRVSALLALLASLLSGPPLHAAERYDPRLRFRTTRTAHFDIHAHQGEEALARRLAVIAERVRQQFVPVLGTPRGRVQVILVDQTDLSNGWATPFPYDAIEITAVPPPPESLIGNTTDWLELVFTHEYTHILHLDRSRGLMQGVRSVFGRVPVAFPNAFLPQWQIEGIATYQESRMTGLGRVPAGDFRAIVDMAAAADRFEPRDRASGGLSDWPSGNAAYVYGAYFHQFLADQYGPERLSQLADATSGRIPLLGAGAFKRVYGQSVGDLWKQFEKAHQRRAVSASTTDAAATRLTRHGFVVTAPRVSPDASIYYRVSNADGYPALMHLVPGQAPQRLAWRALGDRTSVRGDWVVFDQLERVRSVALLSDLYAVRTSGGEVHRLTRAARAGNPDLSPDARTIACTIQVPGRRTLALVEFDPGSASPAAPRTLVDDPEADFMGPRWSPDATMLVAERRRRGMFEIVIIDVDTGTVREIARYSRRLITPSWTADGKAVMFSAEVNGAAFNVFAVDLATRQIRQVTDTAGGARFPELSADGTLTNVGYTPDGYDLFSIRTDPSGWEPVQLRFGDANADVPADRAPSAPSTDVAYSPIRTLLPTYWTPVLQSDRGETLVGAGTAMTDALGRHAYGASAAWSVNRARPDWSVSYAYDRWRPTLVASYSDDTDPVRGGEIRSRELFTGAVLAFRKLRRSDTFLAGFDAERDTLTCTSACRVPFAQRDLRSARGGWLHDSRRQFGYSISTEEGFALETAVESSPRSLGSDAVAGAAIIDLRGFRRVFGTHTVLAARAAVAASWGDLKARRLFSASGSGPSYPVFDFGRDAIGLLRGFDPEDVLGTRAAVVNVDVRFPLARPQRGPGSWPVFVHSLHGAAFADLGHGWDSVFRAADMRSSLGGELGADLVVFHGLPVTLAGGVAWTRDPSAAARNQAAAFARLGYAF